MTCDCRDIEGQLEDLRKHIAKLHDMINLEDRITASDVLCRLTKLEDNNQAKHVCISHYKDVMEEINKINRKLGHTQKPHKFPVCDGKYIAIFKECESACFACDKGIVWG